MSEQRAFGASTFSPETTRAVADAGLAAWTQITQQIVDQTFRTIGTQMELGRRMAGSRSIGEFLDAQAELSQRTVQSVLECGRKITETGQQMTREVTGQLTDTVNVAAETTAQQARVAEEQFKATADQTRNVMKAAAREADEAVERARRNSGNAMQAGHQGGEQAKKAGAAR